MLFICLVRNLSSRIVEYPTDDDGFDVRDDAADDEDDDGDDGDVVPADVKLICIWLA